MIQLTSQMFLQTKKEQSKDKLMTNVFTEVLIKCPKRGSFIKPKRSIYSCYPVRYPRYLVVHVLIFR